MDEDSTGNIEELSLSYTNDLNQDEIRSEYKISF